MAISKIEDAISDFKKGKFVIVIDDKKRENEGDLVIAAEKVTPQHVNFMIKHGRGLVCVPMMKERLLELGLPQMVSINTEFTRCAFTVTVDSIHGTTTGISAFDRAKTIKALINKNTKPEDLSMPGHIFPIRCHDKGLLGRQGHTESSIELAKLSGLYPATVICEIIGESGRMARLPELEIFAKKHDIKIITIENFAKFTL